MSTDVISAYLISLTENFELAGSLADSLMKISKMRKELSELQRLAIKFHIRVDSFAINQDPDQKQNLFSLQEGASNQAVFCSDFMMKALINDFSGLVDLARKKIQKDATALGFTNPEQSSALSGEYKAIIHFIAIMRDQIPTECIKTIAAETRTNVIALRFYSSKGETAFHHRMDSLCMIIRMAIPALIRRAMVLIDAAIKEESRYMISVQVSSHQSFASPLALQA